MSKTSKIIILACTVATVIFCITVLVYPEAKRIYDAGKFTRDANAAIAQLKKLQAEDYAAAMADTYGGKTPEETLSMYIDAVGKRNYELASKYFIGQNQQKKLENFRSGIIVSDQELKTYLDKLRDASKNGGVYSQNHDYFSFNGKILINFRLYPNGVWKIIEI